jgi:hypothetical protein
LASIAKVIIGLCNKKIKANIYRIRSSSCRGRAKKKKGENLVISSLIHTALFYAICEYHPYLQGEVILERRTLTCTRLDGGETLRVSVCQVGVFLI